MIRIGLILFSLVLGLAIAEIILRSFYNPPDFIGYRLPDEKLGWRLRPNTHIVAKTLDYDVDYTINSKGYRDVEHDYEKPAGTFRIVILGDSFMEGHSVNWEDHFASRLAEQLEANGYTNVEIINMGVHGYGMIEEYLTFVLEGEKYDPDMVIMGFFSSGLRRTYPFYQDRGYLPITDEQIETWVHPSYEDNVKLVENHRWVETLSLYEVYVRIVGNLFQRPGVDIPRRETGSCDYSEQYQGVWQLTEDVMDTLNDRVNAIGAELVVFTIPTASEFSGDYDSGDLALLDAPPIYCFDTSPIFYELENVINDDVTFVNMLPLMQASGQDDFYFTYDLHWDETAHEFAAREVFQALEDHALLEEGQQN